MIIRTIIFLGLITNIIAVALSLFVIMLYAMTTGGVMWGSAATLVLNGVIAILCYDYLRRCET